MKKLTRTKHVHAGGYIARVKVELIEDDAGWYPYLDVEEAQKLDKIRKALEEGKIKAAAQYGEVYEMRRVSRPSTVDPRPVFPVFDFDLSTIDR